ncbi:hypothetical protein RhiirA1_235833 [Rhizophagus irregularis]|uniref:Uncharacterized protein n=1 Tax=Rhizophagus irregularis TaxID=588596 RepID=A0A2I1EZX4_9GLOM|nr:hypothetical protein RhiirA1_235833 [Rhizophagus irregularis]PKY27681.1 hypothetical protein RhiirB3_18827 [Rhizophagus irregularis]GET52119.1 hypothetical protein RIR_e76646_A0A2I1EZX4_9GLOM [Rhizophagus irregularis DAOM 181602=DAOM 197198]
MQSIFFFHFYYLVIYETIKGFKSTLNRCVFCYSGSRILYYGQAQGSKHARARNDITNRKIIYFNSPKYLVKISFLMNLKSSRILP